VCGYEETMRTDQDILMEALGVPVGTVGLVRAGIIVVVAVSGSP